MNIGFIGAGKVGFSLGKYLTERNVRVTGYYSRNPDSSREAADFTNTRQYMNLRHLVEDSDVLFVAIPDSAIAPMWEQLKMLPIQNKIISHFSGSLSSAVFSDIERYHAYGYSIHPLFAINDKYESYKVISQAFFTIEGDPKYLNWFQKLFEGFGNPVEIISGQDKVRYHAAAASQQSVCGIGKFVRGNVAELRIFRCKCASCIVTADDGKYGKHCSIQTGWSLDRPN